MNQYQLYGSINHSKLKKFTDTVDKTFKLQDEAIEKKGDCNGIWEKEYDTKFPTLQLHDYDDKDDTSQLKYETKEPIAFVEEKLDEFEYGLSIYFDIKDLGVSGLVAVNIPENIIKEFVLKYLEKKGVLK